MGKTECLPNFSVKLNCPEIKSLLMYGISSLMDYCATIRNDTCEEFVIIQEIIKPSQKRKM